MSEKWMTFDCFGTLVDWHTGFRNLLRPVAGERTDELVAAYHRWEPELERAKPHRLYREVLAEGVRRGAKDISLTLAEGAAESLARAWGTQPVFADVEPALAALRSDGWKLAVLTNCDVALFAETQKSFRHPFDLVVTAEEVRSYKPAPGHFEYFSRATGVSRARWIHAACSWFHDIAPARELDVMRIWIDRDRSGHDQSAATRYLRDATSLPGVAAGLVPS